MPDSNFRPAIEISPLRFGAGELANFYRIYVPLNQNDRWDLHTFNKNVREPGPRGKRFSEYDRPTLWVFSSDIGGDWFAWDIAEVTNKEAHEYAIYELPRDDKKIKRIAKSFSEHVGHCCKRDYWEKAEKGKKHDEEWSFGPFRRSPK